MIDLSWYRSIMIRYIAPATVQLNIGLLFLDAAVSCLNLACGVPGEYEKGLLDESERLARHALALGCPEARDPMWGLGHPTMPTEPSFCEEEDFPYLDREALEVKRDALWEAEARFLSQERDYDDSVFLLEVFASI